MPLSLRSGAVAVLLALTAFPARAQDHRVYYGCENAPWYLKILRCTSDPPLWSVPVRDTLRPVFPDPGESRYPESVSRYHAASATLLAPNATPRPSRVDRSVLGYRPRVSVHPVKGRPDVLRITPYLGGPQDEDSCALENETLSEPDSTEAVSTAAATSADCNVAYFNFLHRDRQFVRFVHTSHGPEPFAVPVKLRVHRWRGSSSTEPAPALSVGGMYGWRAVERSYRYEPGAEAPIQTTGFSLGLAAGLGFSVEELTPGNSSAAQTPIPTDQSESMLVLSPTFAVQVGYGKVRTGLYFGLDLRANPGPSEWNDQGALWLGLGFTTELPFSF